MKTTVLLSGTKYNFQPILEQRLVSLPLFEYLYLQPGTVVRSAIDPATYTAGTAAQTARAEYPVIQQLTEINALEYLANESVEIEGLVAQIESDGKIYVSGVQVETDEDTLGFSQSEIQVFDLDFVENERVRITGTAIDSTGIVARDVHFLDRQ